MDLDGLNPRQREAVQHPSGPLLVFAGAGSGKTRVLTMRIARLVADGTDPARILAVTFTNRAAREMRERLQAALGRRPDGMWVGTFHALAVRMLRGHVDRLGYRAGFVVFDEEDQRSLVKRALADLDLDPRKHPVAPLLEAISRAKSEVRLPADLRAGSAEDRALAEIYERYQRLARESNGMDFDDLLLNLVVLWREHADVAAEWSGRFDHVLVDEYQDTNHCQYELLLTLARDHRNLTVVGDDDQSIYGFRGADVRNILGFQRDFPDAAVVKLEQNYRSTQPILDAAHHVIRANPERADKRLWTERDRGRRPVLVLAPDDEAEAEFAAEEIVRLQREEGWTFADFVILFRTNAQSRPFERALLTRRIPYNLVGGLRFWDRREVKDLVAYLRFAANPADAVSFDRIANVPRRRISEKTAQAAIAAAADGGEELLAVCGRPEATGVRPEAAEALREFHAALAPLVAAASAVPPGDLVQAVIRAANLAAHYDDGTPAGRRRLDNLAEVRSIAAGYDRLGAGRGLERFLTDLALSTDSDEVEDGRDRVTMITLHMAKGLEYPVVFLSGLEDGMLPHGRSIAEDRGLEEERRLAYVGITRAKRVLYLLCANVRTLFGKATTMPSSRFLKDLPAGAVELVELDGHRSQGLAAHLRRASEKSA